MPIATKNINAEKIQGNLSINSITANTISATTISGGTLYGDGSNLTGLSTGLNVGTTQITNGTDTRVLFQSGTTLQQDGNFTFDSTLKRLTLKAIGSGTSDTPFIIQNSAGTVNLLEQNGVGSLLARSNDTFSYLGLFYRGDGANGWTLTNSHSGFGLGTGIETVGNNLYFLTTGVRALSVSTQGTGTFKTYGIWNYGSGSGQRLLIGENVFDPQLTLSGLGNLGLGTYNAGARLDVRAQGALSTDIAFRVRNSADSYNLISLDGQGALIARVGAVNASWTIANAGGITKFTYGVSNSEGVLNVGGALTAYSITDARVISAGIGGKGKLAIGTTSNATVLPNEASTNILFIANGTAPALNYANNFQLYSADRGGVAGKASAHFRAEDGTINVIGDLSGFGTSAPGARLDVRAQGALSTDIAFRVRNSADTANIITVLGTNDVYIGANTTAAGQGHLFNIRNAGSTSTPFAYFDNNSYNFDVDRFCNIKLGFGLIAANSTQSLALGLGTLPSSRNYQQTVGILTAISQGTNDSGFAMSGADTSGNNAIYTNYYGRNIVLGGTTQGTGTRKIVLNSGTAPTTNLTDAFQLYSADITAGNAAPHFRTENGSIIKLYQQPSVTTSQGIADVLTNLGFISSGSTIDSIDQLQVVLNSQVYS